jgi:ABC-type nitrate/sulfonate/bicarbonate transport system permease component
MRGAVLPLLLLAAWELISHSHLVDPRILPPSEPVAQTVFDQVMQVTYNFFITWL